MRKPLSYALIPLMSAGTAMADWRTDIGWDNLQDWASVNGVTIPTSTNLTIGVVEAISGGGYVPDTSSAQLSDESITDISQVSVSNSSSHATSVSSRFFGNSSSLIPSVGQVNVYEANDFITRTNTLSPTSWSEAILSHAWIGNYEENREATTAAVSALMDATTNSLHIVGVGNGATNTQADLYCHNYNNISVGRSDGKHYYGLIPNGYEGAGRQKPEIVNPQTTTSIATGATASVALLLRAHAEQHSSSNASLPVVIKSCMLAGANKLKFSDWDNTATRPIDEIYGAGETDILSSFRILNETESSSGNVGLRGWDYNTFRRGSVEYTITIPDHASSANLCANLSWNRSASGGSYGTLINYSLTLRDSSNSIVFSSDSPVDNIEHIWQTDLKPDNYTLTVAKSNFTNTNTSYALAWRVDIETNSSPSTFVQTASENQLGFTDLAPSHSYFLERSSDLTSWTPVSTLTSTASGTLDYNDPNSSLGSLVFYRLRYFSP